MSEEWLDGYMHGVLDACNHYEGRGIKAPAGPPAPPPGLAMPTSGRFEPPQALGMGYAPDAPLYVFHPDDPWALQWLLDTLTERTVAIACIHPSAWDGDGYSAIPLVCDGSPTSIRRAYYLSLAAFYTWRASNLPPGD